MRDKLTPLRFNDLFDGGDLSERVGNKEFNSQACRTNIHFQIGVPDKDFADITQHTPVSTFVEVFSADEFQRRLTNGAILRSVFPVQEALEFGVAIGLLGK